MITSYSKRNKKIVNKNTHLRCLSSCLICAGFTSDEPNETLFNLMSCRHFDSVYFVGVADVCYICWAALKIMNVNNEQLCKGFP